MTEYRSGQSPTFSMLATMMAMTALPFVAPAQALAFSARSYTPLQAPATVQISHVEPVATADAGALMSVMADCYRQMSEAQVALDPDIAKILHQNLWNLYVED
jgi:hypothetical protein